MKMMKKKHNRYGGADRPLDWMSLKLPMLEMMVGTKRGSEANETLLVILSVVDCAIGRWCAYQAKYMIPGKNDLGSLKASNISPIRRPWFLSTSSRWLRATK